MKPSRNDRFQNCSEFRQAIQGIPLAINWKFVSNSLWKGILKGEKYKLTLNKKRTGYVIDFTKNSRKNNKFCRSQIEDKAIAQKEFFKIIKETTIKI